MDCYLDSLLNDTSDSLCVNTFQKQQYIPIFNTPSIKFENSNFGQQFCQEIQSNETNQLNVKQFIYQLIPQYSISQTEHCYVIAINKDCSTLLAG
ncbi:unnamed protein product [Paramecium octaurelia]|uniref:Uncharacterized protein n=1 Tax=Paramecium octaurelia TaxID=43137 RepID=A0A8S1YK98_PAROT|nr:unnamed protein product [Paramecium octaurelia]